MRKGWKEWMDAGSPELTPETKRKYKFDSRFLDDMLRVSWDTAFTYAAKAMIIIATRYSGEAGARRLREQGYAPEMIEMMKGAGTRMFQASRRHAGPRHHRQDGQHPDERGRQRAAGHLDPEGQPGSGPGRPLLVELYLARRPEPVAPLVVRGPGVRRRPLRHALLQAEHQLGQELRREQDAGSPLEAGMYRAGRPGRGDHAGV